MTRNNTTDLGIHLHDGEIVQEVDHQEHEFSGGLYPVVKLNLGSLALTIFPGRDRAVELADALTLMAAELRAGADRASTEALSQMLQD